MKIINSSYEILTDISPNALEELRQIEKVARTCYKSEDAIDEDGRSAQRLVSHLVENKHEAMLEHSYLSVKFICDRGVSHEIVRHRLFSFAQESTRYCNYSKDKFNGEITVIKPSLFSEDSFDYDIWKESCKVAESAYFKLIRIGCTPEMARDVLPMSVKTEIVVSGNYREWRHFFELRDNPKAHPQMVELAKPLHKELHEKIPFVF